MKMSVGQATPRDEKALAPAALPPSSVNVQSTRRFETPPSAAQANPPPPQLTSGSGGATGAQTTATRYRTVTLNPIDRDGKPGVAVGFLHNLDDPRRYASFVVAAGAGTLSFRVPEGPGLGVEIDEDKLRHLERLNEQQGDFVFYGEFERSEPRYMGMY